ncbi:hypothetical protein B484DRAFT_436800 [Ochromonadaceae sp. CCMP2298]|nr:hypothetical protein B484DRAFT_436800 [Ochromonadaceae sp. CCMP2298]
MVKRLLTCALETTVSLWQLLGYAMLREEPSVQRAELPLFCMCEWRGRGCDTEGIAVLDGVAVQGAGFNGVAVQGAGLDGLAVQGIAGLEAAPLPGVPAMQQDIAEAAAEGYRFYGIW